MSTKKKNPTKNAFYREVTNKDEKAAQDSQEKAALRKKILDTESNEPDVKPVTKMPKVLYVVDSETGGCQCGAATFLGLRTINAACAMDPGTFVGLYKLVDTLQVQQPPPRPRLLRRVAGGVKR